VPKSDTEKRDQFLVRHSKITKKLAQAEGMKVPV
jgi:hypothetical protein